MTPPGRPARRRRYLERAVDRLLDELDRIDRADRVASSAGLLQRLDPRVKLLGLLALTLAVTFVSHAWTIAAVLALATMLGWLSGIGPRALALRVWIGAFAFTGALALPAIVLTPGDAVGRIPLAGWPVTAQGLRSALLLLLRVEATGTLAFVFVSTTPWTRLLKALRILRVPVAAVVVLGMTVRYVVLLLQAAHDMFDARRSRTTGSLDPAVRRRLATATAGVLLDRTLHLGSEVHLAMQARGFRGEVHVLEEPAMQTRDWAALAAFTALAALAAWSGR